ncbi:hypothetical protein AR546_11305 [Leptospira interrogans serovar Canicola]|uniref:hypothetical protein n=1 Tax=Leptospira interrogans TaxID=173 RepID=UPI000308C671|nr:hypothetical protein [Leptospira interrogans]ASV05475.1 hypothetical protein B2G47_04620 [Leptospira interrogans serovar Canicola]OMH63195.1 hypothetical protein BW243_14170 [Leptospira interrogans serovar Pomona]ASV08939.1 hypothetical protein B2G50_09015 [Leptospira interrogans serovar Canicola]OLZ31215.1 hypothetical protein AR546_11305 [Leptospira interrogans serovar Canicola]POR19081.1 hypothetical protein B0T34_07440 [Leptospira interrogans serovar Canicola]
MAKKLSRSAGGIVEFRGRPLSFILINRGEIQTHGLQHDAPIPLEFQKSITWNSRYSNSSG